MPIDIADPGFPHTLTIDIPFSTHRLAKVALGSLSVDEELSELVKRNFTLIIPKDGRDDQLTEAGHAESLTSSTTSLESKTVLQVHYEATTPRMLRVAVNGFFESLGVIVQVMEGLDVDVLHEQGIEGLDGVQGVEQGMTGTAQGVAR